VRDLQLKDKGFHSRSNASERRMSEIMSSTLSAMGSPFGASRLAGVKSENNASMSSNMIVPSGSIGLNKMKSKFMSGAFKAKNIKKNALGGLNGLGKTSSNIGSKVTSKGTPPPPPFKQKGAQKNAKGKTINALDLLESSPPQLVSPFITSIVKTNQIINGTELEDSISIHNKRKLSGSTGNNGEIKHSKSTHNAKNGFLNKLSKRNAKKNMESKLDIIDRQKQASSFNTSNLQRKCLVTCELLDPQTHTIIMQNEAISNMSDYVLSNDTVSKVLAMVAESREVKTVLRELLGSDGCDIHVHPLQRYVALQRTVSNNEYSYW